MFKKKRSLFERLTGGVSLDEDYDAFEDERVHQKESHTSLRQTLPTEEEESDSPYSTEPESAEEPEGQLPVDVYESSNDIIIRAFVAGVRADSLDISISRDMVEVSGARETRDEVQESDYFHQELYWGSFTRTILLPEEIDVEAASASSKDGLLTIILPKLDKKKQTKLKVKNS